MEAIIKSAFSLFVDVTDNQNGASFIDVFIQKLKALRGEFATELRDSFISFEDGVTQMKDINLSGENESSSKPSVPKFYFQEASNKAKKAFDDVSLSIEDKIKASKIRIASSILENVHDCELATDHSMQCLNELNSFCDFKHIILDSVLFINIALASFIFEHTKKRMSVMEWPMIQYGGQEIHPFYYKKIEGITTGTLPWYSTDFFKNRGELFSKEMIVTSEGELLIFDENKLQKLDNETEKLQPWCNENLDVDIRQVSCMNVDDNGVVYLVFGYKDKPNGSYLLTLCSQDKSVEILTLKFLNDKKFSKVFLAAIPNDKIIIATIQNGQRKITIYVCNRKSGVVSNFIAKGKRKPIDEEMECLSISSNENIAVLTHRLSQFYRLIIWTMHGKFVKKMKFQPHLTEIKAYNQVFYTSLTNYVTGFYFQDDKSKLVLEFFSVETSKFVSSIMLRNAGYDLQMFTGSVRLVHHANGKMVLVTREHTIHLNKGCSEYGANDAKLTSEKTSKLNTRLKKSISLPIVKKTSRLTSISDTTSLHSSSTMTAFFNVQQSDFDTKEFTAREDVYKELYKMRQRVEQLEKELQEQRERQLEVIRQELRVEQLDSVRLELRNEQLKYVRQELRKELYQDVQKEPLEK